MDNDILDKLISSEDSSLWEHQKKAKTQIYESWKECRSIMLQMPTGTGKTRLFVSIIVDFLNHGLNRILVIAHRKELIEQIQKELERQGREYYSNDLQSVIITSPVKANNRIRRLQNMDLIIIDEAHHTIAESYKNILFQNAEANVLGVTATPIRLDGKGFAKFYDKLIVTDTVRDFIKKKVLCNYKYYSIRPQSYISTEIGKIIYSTYGDYDVSSMNQYFNTKRIRTDVLNMYKRFANGKKGIIYTINRTHNIDLAKRFIQDGIKARYIDSDTPDDIREKTVREFRLGLFDVLLNVNIFTEGFDCPDVEFIMLARPTMSLGLYLQQVGRGLRYIEGKKPLLILDAVGLYLKFGLPDIKRYWEAYFSGADDSSIERKNYIKYIIDFEKYISEGDDPVDLINYVDEVDESEPENHSKWRKIGALYNKLLSIAKHTSQTYIKDISEKNVVSYKPILGYNIFNPCETIKCQYFVEQISNLLPHRRKPTITDNVIQYSKFDSEIDFIQYEMKIMRICFYDSYIEASSEIIDEFKQYDIFDLITYIGQKYGKDSYYYSQLTEIALNEDLAKLNIRSLFENEILRSITTQQPTT